MKNKKSKRKKANEILKKGLKEWNALPKSQREELKRRWMLRDCLTHLMSGFFDLCAVKSDVAKRVIIVTATNLMCDAQDLSIFTKDKQKT